MIDVQEKISKFKADELDEAKFIQDKLQLFTLPFCRETSCNTYFRQYLKSMEAKINNKTAFRTFKENINFPLPTVTFCKTVANSMYKIFQGDNKFIKFYPEPKSKDGIPTLDYITNDVWDRFVNAPNTLILTQEKNRYFIDISSVLYLTVNEDLTVNEIIYKTIENQYWYVNNFNIEKYDIEYNLLSEEEHALKTTPVDFISNKLLDYRKPLIRVNFFIDSLGELEELLSIGICSNIINRHIVPYLVKASQRGCKYKQGDLFCNDGYIYKTIENREPLAVMTDGKYVKCEHCNSEIGFGSVVEITTTNLNPDEIAKLIQNAISYKNLDIDILKYPSEAKEKFEDDLFNKIVNKQERLNNAQQHNEARVLSTYEDRINVILFWKACFENIYSNLITKSIQSSEKNYIKTEVNLGNKFYLNSETEYQALIQKAQETETTDFVDYYRGLIDKQYSGNPSEKERALFILDLQVSGKPFFNVNTKDLISLNKDGIVIPEQLRLNMNYNMYIRQIELDEKENINQLYIEKDYSDRILLINQKIKEYASR